MLLFPRARVDVLVIIIILIRIFTLPAWTMLALWFGLQLVGAAGSDTDSGGVAYWAHAGGFVVGAVLALPTWLRLGGPGYWRRNNLVPPHPERIYQRSRIPTVRRR